MYFETCKDTVLAKKNYIGYISLQLIIFRYFISLYMHSVFNYTNINTDKMGFKGLKS